MAQEATPDFRVNIYGNDPGRFLDTQRDLTLGGPRGTGGGFPWFRGGSKPSPYNPSGPQQTPPPEGPPEPQGPPDTRSGGLFAGLSGKDLMSLLAALTGSVGALRSGQPSGPSSATSDPAMQEVLNLMAGRLRKSEPMFDSVQAMANGLLPTAYQNRGPAPTGAPPAAMPFQPPDEQER